MTTKNPVRRTYTEAFKGEAVALITEQGYKLSEAARSVDVNANLLSKWRDRFAEEAAGTRLTGDERDELKQLRKEVRLLKMEKEILKKKDDDDDEDMKDEKKKEEELVKEKKEDEESKKEKVIVEKNFEYLNNPSRVLPDQLHYLTFDKDLKYVPIKKDYEIGIMLLKNLKPNEEEVFVQLKNNDILDDEKDEPKPPAEFEWKN